MKPETKESWALLGKTVLLVIGGILVVAALVELVVGGWSARAGLVLLLGLLCVAPPLGFAFRDAVREARKGKEG